MSKDSVSVFDSGVTENVVAKVKSTLGVRPSDEGEMMVEFVTNMGKGSGTQRLPHSELHDALTALSEICENGIPQRGGGENIPAAQVIRDTISIEDGVVSFRVKNGKGAKPARIPVGQFREFIDFMRSAESAIDNRVAALQTRMSGKK